MPMKRVLLFQINTGPIQSIQPPNQSGMPPMGQHTATPGCPGYPGHPGRTGQPTFAPNQARGSPIGGAQIRSSPMAHIGSPMRSSPMAHIGSPMRSSPMAHIGSPVGGVQMAHVDDQLPHVSRPRQAQMHPGNSSRQPRDQINYSPMRQTLVNSSPGRTSQSPGGYPTSGHPPNANSAHSSIGRSPLIPGVNNSSGGNSSPAHITNSPGARSSPAYIPKSSDVGSSYAPKSSAVNSSPARVPDAVLNMSARGAPDKKPWAYAPDKQAIEDQSRRIRRKYEIIY